ncbi:MAG: hypothetical protein CSA21_00845 [Deltaproteobacteria bacterium]|nr:MAG: hypothetical protein CSA21_00845 [Deltaproteobacteria bacterium]
MTFTWDGLNRLVRVDEEGTEVVSYRYDSQNRRISKSTGGTVIQYRYDTEGRLLAETLGNGTPLRDYFYLNGEPVALREYGNNPGIYYYINDQLGTPQQLISETGTVVWQAAYFPFGKAQVQINTVTNNFRFPGQY